MKVVFIIFLIMFSMISQCWPKERKKEVVDILMGSKKGHIIHVGWGKESAKEMQKKLTNSDIPIINALLLEAKSNLDDNQKKDQASSMKIALSFAYIALCDPGLSALKKLCLESHKDSFFMESFFYLAIENLEDVKICSEELNKKANSLLDETDGLCKKW